MLPVTIALGLLPRDYCPYVKDNISDSEAGLSWLFPVSNNKKKKMKKKEDEHIL